MPDQPNLPAGHDLPDAKIYQVICASYRRGAWAGGQLGLLIGLLCGAGGMALTFVILGR